VGAGAVGLNPVFRSAWGAIDGHDHAAGGEATAVLMFVFVGGVAKVAMLVTVECEGDLSGGEHVLGSGGDPHVAKGEERFFRGRVHVSSRREAARS
jgi:hypothetical protein